MTLKYDPTTGKFYRNGIRAELLGDRDGYLRVYYQGKVYRAHRVAWFLSYGYWPDEIDHINGVPDDNRLVNLKDGSHRDNMQNRKMQSNNSSGVLGIYFDSSKKRWKAAIKVNGIRIHLGVFKTKEEAISARKKAEQQYRP